MRRRNTRLQQGFLAVSAAIVAAFYAIMGFVLIFYPAPFVRKQLSADTLLVAGSALILYGGFRAYRAYAQWIASQR